MSQLVLGTAQLGMQYGIANTTGKPDATSAVEIVRAAWEGGIQEFDTAQEYGQSERVLSSAFQKLGIADRVKVITKLRKDIDMEDESAVLDAVQESVGRLGVPILHAVLLHKEGELGRLNLAVDQGLTKHIGMSVYSPERALAALEKDIVTVLEVPSNMLDRRFETGRVFQRAQQLMKTVYLRSVFLQGLLLMRLDDVPVQMEFAKPLIQRVGDLAVQFGLSNLELALGYLRLAFPCARVIVGAETPLQIHEIMSAWHCDVPAGVVDSVRETFANVHLRILDPRLWPKTH